VNSISIRTCVSIFATFLILAVAITAPVGAVSEAEKIVFTVAEKEWLAAHSKIVVGGETDWAPFDFVDRTGKYVGIADDYLKIIEEKLGIGVEMVTGPSWDELLTMLRRKEIDVLPAIYHSKEREAYVHFTAPYLKLNEFIFTSSDNQTIAGFEDLKDQTIVVVKGYTIEGYLRSNYPNYGLIAVPTIADALYKIVTGDADAFIVDFVSTSYNMRERMIIGIKPIAKVPIPGPSVHMGVRKDWPVLRALIDKALKAIPASGHEAIKKRWITLAEKRIAQGRPEIGLSDQEITWLEKHPVIRVHNEKDWAPFNFFENSRPKGFSIDYMNLLASKLGIEVQYVSGPTWNDFINMIKNNELDVMLNIARSPEREKFLAFTASYVTMLQALYTRDNAPLVSSIDDLYGKTFAIPKGFYLQEVLKSHPEIRILEVSNTTEAIQAVAYGKADVMFDLMPVVDYIADQRQVTNLKVGGDLGIVEGKPIPLHIGMRKDLAPLAGILEKAMKAVTDDELRELRVKWLGDSDKQQVKGKLRADFRHRPPEMIIERGRLLGPLKDILEEAVGISGYTIEWRVAPFKESLQGLKTGQVDIVPRTIRKKEREAFINFLGPIKVQKKDILFMVPKGVEESIRVYEDLYNLSVGIKAKTAYFPNFDKDTSINKISTEGEDYDLAQMLIDGRINAIAVLDRTPIEMAMKELNHSDYAYAQYRYEQTIGNYFGMSRTSQYAAFYPKLNKTLLEMASSGRISQIYIKHEALAKTLPDIRIHLADTEKRWLAKNQDLRLGIDPAWPPFEFIDTNGNYAGIGSGFIEAISDRLNIKMSPIPGLTWSQVIEKAKTGEIDVLPVVTRTSERDKYLNFTKPYLSFPVVIAVNKKTPFISSIKDLEGYRVGVVKDYYTEDILRNDHPYLKFVTYATLAEALQELDAGDIDAFVGNMITISQEIARSGLKNTRISASTEYTFDLSLGVRKDLPEFIGILNKVIDDISSQEKAAIKSTWMSDVEVKIQFDIKAILAWAIPLGGGAVLIILFVVIWNWRLGNEVTERKKAEDEAKIAAIVIREKEAQLSTAINSMAGAIFMVDKNLNFQLSNEQFSELYDYPKELAKNGMPFLTFLRTRAERGDYGPGGAEKLLAERLERYNDPTQAKLISVRTGIQNSLILLINIA